MSTRDDRFFEGALLPEFDPTPAEAWHEQLAGDLGGNWRERLRTGAGEGLDLLPFYRAEDLAAGDVPAGAPGVRSGWRVRHDLTSDDPDDVPSEAKRALDGGAEALGLPARLANSDDALHALLAEANPSETAFHLEGAPDHARALFAEADTPRGSLTFDPTAQRLQHEDFDAADGYHRLADLLPGKDEQQHAPAFRLVTADARPFHEAGAGAVASLALALAAMGEHFARLTEEGVAVRAVGAHAQMVLPVGTRFFVEVARLRAARRLFAQLAEAYGADGSESGPARLHIQAQTAWRPVTLYDPHLNLLRGGTAGAMAAVLGGADVLGVRPFDAAQDDPSDFGRRLSLNAQHVLREEAHLGRVADPAAGSYYGEVLTDRIARRAWQRFQEIEAEGGLLDALRSGTLQERLADARAERQNAMHRRERVRVGTNQYPNVDEKRLDDAPERSGPLREADAFERLRLATERHARRQGTDRPAAFLLPVGTPKVRSARASFARSALGCAGFRAVENVGFDSAEKGAQAAAEAVRSGEADLVACCAPDADYAALLPALREALGNADATDAPIVVAGPPDALPEKQHEAADAFLHRGMNLLETLDALQERLGISRRS